MCRVPRALTVQAQEAAGCVEDTHMSRIVKCDLLQHLLPCLDPTQLAHLKGLCDEFDQVRLWEKLLGVCVCACVHARLYLWD